MNVCNLHLIMFQVRTFSSVCENSQSIVKMSSSHDVTFSFHMLNTSFTTWEKAISIRTFSQGATSCFPSTHTASLNKMQLRVLLQPETDTLSCSSLFSVTSRPSSAHLCLCVIENECVCICTARVMC